MRRIVFGLFVLSILMFTAACSSARSNSDAGQSLAVLKGCAACHAVDETPKIGPTWVGLYGSQ